MNTNEYIIDMIKTCDTAFFSTLNSNNVPETRALSNEFNRNVSDIKELYFTTSTNSPKFQQIKENSNSSLYYYINENMKNLTLFGKTEIITDKSTKDKLWKDEFKVFYPNGKDDELYGIIKFIPESYKYYAVIDGNFAKLEGEIDNN